MHAHAGRMGLAVGVHMRILLAGDDVDGSGSLDARLRADGRCCLHVAFTCEQSLLALLETLRPLDLRAAAHTHHS